MMFKQWLEAEKVKWSISWPNRKGTGDDPHEQDTPPQMLGDNYVVYHGTNMIFAQQIMAQRRVAHDDIGYCGICTTPRAASVYASMKSDAKKNIPSVVLSLVLDGKWLNQQEITREVGGSGKDQWLLGIKEIPPQAIKDIKIYSIWGERQ
jgi:hypothetical protein